MRSNGRPINVNLSSQTDYQKQQERLKAMSSTSDKVKSLTADLMIENLLKESSFRSVQHKKSECQVDLPLWLRCDSSMSPPEYRYLWSLVQSSISMADTQKVSQLLLTSGLHLDVLGHIWNLANRAVPGQLTKQEFYIVLTLVNLAQTGVSFNNLDILKLIQAPVIPLLQPDVLQKQLPQSQPFFRNDHPQVNIKQQFSNSIPPQPLSVGYSGETNPKTSASAHGRTSSAFNYDMCRTSGVVRPDTKNLSSDEKLGMQNTFHQTFSIPYSHSNFPCIGSSPTTELEDDFSDFQSVTAHESDSPKTVSQPPLKTNEETNDEFTDFQSASLPPSGSIDPFETIIVQQKREIPKIPLPKNLTGKFTNIKSTILKISPESERKLKVLSKNESLSSLPESKISSTNKVSTCISVLGSNHGIGSRLANHSLSMKTNRSKTHKHQKTKSPPNPSSPEAGDGEIIFGVNTKNFESVIPKCCPKKPATFILKETKIHDIESPDVKQDQGIFNAAGACSRENTRKIEIPMLGTFNETVLPTQTSSKLEPSGSVDLFSIVEDKYSALREIELSDNSTERIPDSSTEVINDDFGDFLSADIPPPNHEVSESKSRDLSKQDVTVAPVETEDQDNWGDWSCNTDVSKEPVSANLFPVVQSTEKSTEQNFAVGNSISDPFNLLCLEDELEAKPSSVPEQFTAPDSDSLFLSTTSPLEGTKEDISQKPKLDLELPKSSQVTTIESSITNNNNQTDNDLWDLFLESTGPGQMPGTAPLTRHDSLPSLDFKISPNEETDQEIIWRKCLETCQCIIQEAVDSLEAILDKNVLKEVFANPKTIDYVNCLKIAYEITRRISRNYSDQLPIQEDLERLWSRLEKLIVEHKIQIKEDVDTVPEGTNQCRICLGNAGYDCVSQGNHTYHPSCANLWVNCIDGNLPFAS